jgi:thioesterase domain-containing protein
MPESSASCAATRYLHEHIPLTSHMGIEVVSDGADGVRLGAPLAPNINHCQTVFGGSAASLATLACWMFLHLRLRHDHPERNIIVRRSQIEYDRPIDGNFSAWCRPPQLDPWQRLLDDLGARGKGRIELDATLSQDGVTAARFCGLFVVVQSSESISDV